jgi:hypothetical protein
MKDTEMSHSTNDGWPGQGTKTGDDSDGEGEN